MTGSHRRDFLRLLESFEPRTFERSRNIVFGLWPDLTLAYFNPAWQRFAADNGGEPAISERWNVNCRVLDAVPAVLQPFFEGNYLRCLHERRPWEHVYECSSAKLFRRFHMSCFPLGNQEGLLVVNSLRVEEPHARAASEPLATQYTQPNGMIIQCCHCRRVCRANDRNVWDWVPLWVEHPPEGCSHSLCDACFGFYYSPDMAKLINFPRPFKTEES